MIDRHLVGYNHLLSNKCEWDNCFIKNNQELLLDLTDFALSEQPEDWSLFLGHGIMVHTAVYHCC